MRKFENYGAKDTINIRLLRIMKITAILLFTCIGVCQAVSSYSQSTNLTLNLRDKTIKEVFKEIERNSEFVFFYFDKDVDLNRKVSVNVKGKKVNEVLDQIFTATDTGYLIKDRQVYISKKAPEEVKQSKKKRITGTVSDSNGDPLIGVTVSVRNTTNGTVSNIEGLYVIDALETDELVFNYVGFLKQEVRVGNKGVINITLQEDEQMLEEVVIVGYGQQNKASVVSSVSTVTSKELSAPTSNLTNNLGGQLAGLISIQRSGEPGRDDAEFWIRGISTFKGGTKPLVLVDGIPRAISNIEPDEIETFSLLKDAAATAVYGAEGANGVILITSKRGNISKPKISFRGEYSISKPTRLPDFVDSWDYLELVNEANFNDGESPYKYPEEIEKYRNRVDNDLYPNSKWMDELLAKNTHNQRYTLNFRGGAENAKYFVSMAYFQQDGIFKQNPMNKYKGNFGFERYNLRSNIDLRVSKSTTLNIDLSGQYVSRTTSNRSPGDIFRFMLHTPPHLFPAIYSDGTLATYLTQSDSNNRNPYNMLMNQGYRKEWGTMIQSNVGVNQDLSFITPGLKFNGKVGLDYDGNYSTLRDFWPSLFFATGRDEEGNLIFQTSVSGSPELQNAAETGNESIRKIYIEGAFNYLRTFNEKHTVGGMFLYMQKERQVSGTVLPYRKQSAVGRATYSYDNKYFIEGSFGYTGSEIFASGKKFGFFPAVGLSYYISNESFYPKALSKVMDKVKIRASYGKAGNDDIGSSDRFLYRATFNEGADGFDQGIGSNGGTNGLGKGIKDVRFVNNNIQWEIEQKRNVGVDLGFFNNKIELTADYFNNRRENILMQRNTIPGVAGFHSNPWANYGIVDNWGTDASLNVRRDFGPVKVSMRGTFTFARNKIIEYDELVPEYPWMAATGSRVGDQYLYIAERLYTEDDFIKTQKDNGTYIYELKPGMPKVTLDGKIGPGDIKYRDMNNDGTIDNFDKVRGVGYPYNPEINYGFGFNVEYKGFYVSAFFQGTGNSSILLASGNNTFWPFNWGVEKSNYRKEFLNRWTADNPRQDVLMPRLHVGYANNVNKEPSTWWLRNGRFLRFKNLEFGYDIPKKHTKKLLIDGARVYVQGYNICVWDDVKYWDPELGNANGGNSYPLPRTFTFGVEINF